MRFRGFLAMLLLIPTSAAAQQCPPDEESKPVEVEPGKFVLRCEHNVPGTNYPNPKSLQGEVATTISGVKIGHQDIETPLPGQPDHFQFIIRNWATEVSIEHLPPSGTVPTSALLSRRGDRCMRAT